MAPRTTSKAERIQMEVLTDFVLDWHREDKERKSDVGKILCFERYAPYFRACAIKLEWLRTAGKTKSKGRQTRENRHTTREAGNGNRKV